MNYWLTIFLLCYVPFIPYCHWIITKGLKTGEFDDSEYILPNEIFAKMVSWAPILNIYFSFAFTMFCILRWYNYKMAKRKIKKLAKKYKGTQIGEDLNNIINKFP